MLPERWKLPADEPLPLLHFFNQRISPALVQLPGCQRSSSPDAQVARSTQRSPWLPRPPDLRCCHYVFISAGSALRRGSESWDSLTRTLEDAWDSNCVHVSGSVLPTPRSHPPNHLAIELNKSSALEDSAKILRTPEDSPPLEGLPCQSTLDIASYLEAAVVKHDP